MLALPHDEVPDNAQMWECTVLVTDAEYDLAAIGPAAGARRARVAAVFRITRDVEYPAPL